MVVELAHDGVSGLRKGLQALLHLRELAPELFLARLLVALAGHGLQAPARLGVHSIGEGAITGAKVEPEAVDVVVVRAPSGLNVNGEVVLGTSRGGGLLLLCSRLFFFFFDSSIVRAGAFGLGRAALAAFLVARKLVVAALAAVPVAGLLVRRGGRGRSLGSDVDDFGLGGVALAALRIAGKLEIAALAAVPVTGLLLRGRGSAGPASALGRSGAALAALLVACKLGVTTGLAVPIAGAFAHFTKQKR